MKKFKILMGLCGVVLWIAGCKVPVGDDLVITRDSIGLHYIVDYQLQTYVPIPKTGNPPVSLVNNRGELDGVVVWKDQGGNELPGLTVFAANTVYQAEIRLTPRDGYGFSPSDSFEYHPGKVSFQNDNRGEPTRTITVIYNNSDDADITFVTDYNLQSYIPLPMAGDMPVRKVLNKGDVTVEAEWEVEQSPGSGSFAPIPTAESYTFVLDTVYRAELRLTANYGYRFNTAKDFEYPAGTVSTQPGANNVVDIRDLSPVVYKRAGMPTVIDDLNLNLYIPKPASGGTAVMSFAGAQYTGKISWKDTAAQTILAGPFQAGTQYTAEVDLLPAIGYTFTGVGQDTFGHTGAQTISNPANSGTIRIGFPVTGNLSVTVVSDTNLTSRVPKPAYGVTPVKSFAGNQYTGAVTWKHTDTQAQLIGYFQPDTPYTAVVVLSALSGYTFNGLGENMFTHGAAGSITNPAGGGTVTINFPPDPFLNYKANSFGPVTVLGSALKLMMDKSGDNRSVTIDLDPGNEPVTPNNALIADLTSPGRLTIDGHHRVLELGDSGTLLTVGEGVTLTLRNITLVGINGSTGPLVEIQARGKLILEGGVTLTDHITTGDAGGIWVNGGELVMYDGVVIKKMELFGYGSGAGVGVSNKGKFVMYGGTIGGENSSDGNKLSPSGIISGPWSNTGGGGVGVSDGSFEMRNGIIQSNGCSGVAVGDKGSFTMHGGAIKGHNGGGGVYNSGTFIMTAGLIKDNIVESPYPPNPVSNFGGGGGVSNFGTFIMDGTDIVIEDNVVGSNYEGGGGVGNWGTFIMNGGTIRRNKGSNGGGGVAVRDGGTFTMNDGTIGGGPGDGNTNIGYNGSNGVYGYGGVKFIMSGGIITGNTANGVYIVGEFHMSGSALITKDNMVGHGSIIIDGNLDNSPAANITVYRVEDNPRLLKADSSELITQNYNKFLYEGVSGHINSTPYYYEDFYGGFWYGVYQEQE